MKSRGRDTAQSFRGGRRGQRSQAVSNACRGINTMIIKSFETGDIADVLAVVAGHLSQMNLVNLTTALHRLAKLTSTSAHSQAHLKRNHVFEQLLQSISWALGSMEPAEVEAQSLSNVAWSLATLKLARVDLFGNVVALATLNLSRFQHFELCTFLWACAKLGAVDSNIARCSEPIFEAAATHIVATASTFSFRCWANLLWAFATAKQYSSSLFSCAIVHMLPQAHVANCQELANTTWALGKVNFLHEKFFCELANHALLFLWEFKPQELSNMIWGFGCVGFFHEEFFAGAAATLQRMELTTQHLANILTAVVRAAPEHPLTRATILNLLPQCCQQASAFKPQEVSATLLAVAKAFGNGGHTPLAVPEVVFRFFEIAAPVVISRLPDFSTQSLASLSGAFTRLRVFGAQHLVDAVSNEASKRRAGGPHRADFHDALHVLSLAECASPTAAYKDSEQTAYVAELSFAPIQAFKKKDNSKRRRGRAQGRGVGPPADSQDGIRDVYEGPAVTASTDLELPWHHASSSSTRGVGSQLSLHKTSQESVSKPIVAVDLNAVGMAHSVNNPIVAVDLCAGGLAVPLPTCKARGAWEVPLQQPSAVRGGAERVSLHAAGNDRAARTRRALSPLVEGSCRSAEMDWNCSVKNSFLHVEYGYDSDSTNDHGSCAGGSSQRSSSVPSRLDYAEPAEEWHKRHMGNGGELTYSQRQRYTDDLAGLNFAWVQPGLLGPSAGGDMTLLAGPAGAVCTPLTGQALIFPVEL